MKNALLKRVFQVVALLTLAVAVTIAGFETMKPSPEYFWREAAESILTKFSAVIHRPIGLRASKIAVQLRKHLSSDETLRVLAASAQRQRDFTLSATTKLILAQRIDAAGGLRLAKEAFDLQPNEMTAWFLSARLLGAGEPVPAIVTSALLNGAAWEYRSILEVDTQLSAVATSVFTKRGNIHDPELFVLAASVRESEDLVDYWTEPANQYAALNYLYSVRATAQVIADRNRFWYCLSEGLVDWCVRTMRGLESIFTDPNPVNLGSLVIRPLRQFTNTIDALGAIGTAATCNDRILAARKALPKLDHEINTLASGEFLNTLERERESKRRSLLSRLQSLRADPQRYPLDYSAIQAALAGKNPTALFLSDAATSRSRS